MKIVIQTTDHSDKSVDRIIEEATKRGHDCERAMNSDFDIIFDEKSYIVSYKGKELSKENIDALYLRKTVKDLELYKIVAEFAYQKGIFVFDYKGIFNYEGKVKVYEQIQSQLKNLSYIPTQINLGGKYKDTLEFPLVGKPVIGSKGEGVELIYDKKSLDGKITNSSQLMLQKYIKNNGDIRCMVLGGKYIGANIRTPGTKGDFRNSTALGGKGMPYELDQKYFEELGNIAQKLGFDLAGFDLVYDDNSNKFYIIEINRSPQFYRDQSFEKVTGINLAEKIILFIEEQTKK